MGDRQTPVYELPRRRTGMVCDPIDVHELLKRNIYSQTSNSDPNFRFDVGMTPPGIGGSMAPAPMLPEPISVQPVIMQNGMYDTQLLFESPYSTGAVSRANGQFSWDLAAINNSKPVVNVVELKSARFFIPNFPTSTTQPDFWFYRRVYMTIADMPEDGIGRGGNGKRYHFEFEVVNINSISVELVPLYDTLYLRVPLNTLSTFTVQFSIPALGLPIPFPADTIVANAVPGSNPAQFVTASTAPLGPVGVPVPTIAVFITGFNNGDVTLGNQVNSTRGWMVTNIVSTTVFEIAGLNFATVVAPVLATVVIGKNRVEIPMRFTSVSDKPTNYITATHD